MHRHEVGLAVALVGLTAGLVVGVTTNPWQTYPESGLSLAAPTPPVSSPSSSPRCVTHGGLPDKTCTPGVVAVTDAAVLCSLGYKTGTVRPPSSYTNRLKGQQMALYGYYAGRDPSAYEEDHLIPLELGGDPRAPGNLWPQSPHKLKDKVENAAKRAVCSGRLGLQYTQSAMAANWEALGVQLGISTP